MSYHEFPSLSSFLNHYKDECVGLVGQPFDARLAPLRDVVVSFLNSEGRTIEVGEFALSGRPVYSAGLPPLVM